VYGITKGVFPRLDSILSFAEIPYCFADSVHGFAVIGCEKQTKNLSRFSFYSYFFLFFKTAAAPITAIAMPL